MRSLFQLVSIAAFLMAFSQVSAAKPSKDAGFLFQDEVSQEIIVDTKSGSSQSEHAFSDLEGRLKPGTKEYQALLHVIEHELKADKNIEVPSLTDLRKKYDLAYGRLALIAESAPVEETSARLPASLELQFSAIPDAGYTNPSLKGYRLIPLDAGAMLVSESGEKRVFGFGNASKGEGFEVSVGEVVDTGSLLALRGKDAVWLIHLSRPSKEQALKIDWSKRLEFPLLETDSLGAPSLKVTVQDQAIAVESGSSIKRLASANGRLLEEPLKASAESSTASSPASESREPASPSAESSIVQPIED